MKLDRIDLRILSSLPKVLNSTFVIDGRHQLFGNISNNGIDAKEYYSYKRKKTALNSQFIINHNGYCVYVSPGHPASSHDVIMYRTYRNVIINGLRNMIHDKYGEDNNRYVGGGDELLTSPGSSHSSISSSSSRTNNNNSQNISSNQISINNSQINRNNNNSNSNSISSVSEKNNNNSQNISSNSSNSSSSINKTFNKHRLLVENYFERLTKKFLICSQRFEMKQDTYYDYIKGLVYLTNSTIEKAQHRYLRNMGLSTNIPRSRSSSPVIPSTFWNDSQDSILPGPVN
ncbi:hypothetical protein WA158_006105 [Blastocystis sp. Blastoise]